MARVWFTRLVGIPVLTLVMAAAINLLVAPAMSLQPILVTDHFGGDVVSLATIQSAFGIGIIVGSLIAGEIQFIWGTNLPAILLVLLTGTFTTLSSMLMQWTPDFLRDRL